MKCSSCSAPLTSNSPVCEYCGTTNDTDLSIINDYTVTKPLSERICPHCTTALQTIDIAQDKTFYIERCYTCFGLFFDNNELEALLDMTVKNVYTINKERLNIVTAHQNYIDKPVQYLKCPVCAALMNRVNAGTYSGVIINRCNDHGIWLDNGELRRLMEWRKSGGKLLQEKMEQNRKQEEERRFKMQKTISTERQYLPSNLYETHDETVFKTLSRVVGFLFEN